MKHKHINTSLKIQGFFLLAVVSMFAVLALPITPATAGSVDSAEVYQWHEEHKRVARV